jgi:hypothetical protein
MARTALQSVSLGAYHVHINLRRDYRDVAEPLEAIIILIKTLLGHDAGFLEGLASIACMKRIELIT